MSNSLVWLQTEYGWVGGLESTKKAEVIYFSNYQANGDGFHLSLMLASMKGMDISKVKPMQAGWYWFESPPHTTELVGPFRGHAEAIENCSETLDKKYK